MRHFANRTFWQGYDRLPQKVRLLADKNFNSKGIRGIRLSISRRLAGSGRLAWASATRALALELADGMLWFWIGSHADYNVQIRLERP